MTVTLDLGPLVTAQRQLARAALASGIAVYVHGLTALVLLTSSMLHPAALVLLLPILVAHARVIRVPARLFVGGRLPKAYDQFILLEILYIGTISVAGGAAGGILAALTMAATARPIVRARKLAREWDPQVRSLRDPRILLACLAKDLRGIVKARARAAAGNRLRLITPWAAAVVSGAAVSLAVVLVLSTIGVEPNSVVGLSGGITAVWVFFRTTRHAKPGAALLRRHDTRPPVLLLRQFGDDALRTGRLTLGVGPTFEHFVAGELARLGPAISVGKPGERLQPLGAARDYLTGDWKRGVEALIHDAGLIVWVLGESENLLWEFRTMMATRGAGGAIVIVPPLGSRAELERRWTRFVEATADVIGGALPRALPDGDVVALFFAGDAPVIVLAERRTPAPSLTSQALPEYRVALRLYEHLRAGALDSKASLTKFIDTHLPLVRAAATDGGAVASPARSSEQAAGQM